MSKYCLTMPVSAKTLGVMNDITHSLGYKSLDQTQKWTVCLVTADSHYSSP